MALGSTQLPIQYIPEGFGSGLKLPKHLAHHFIPYIAEVKNMWSFTSTVHGVVLKSRDNLTSLYRLINTGSFIIMFTRASHWTIS
jgi:hypothetical protein